MGEFGLSMDYRKNKLQLLLALAVTKQGFPFYWKVLPGGLHDCLTVKEVSTCLKNRLGTNNNIILVMDKGMVSRDNLEFLEEEGFTYIVTIARSSVKKLPDFPKELLEKLAKELENQSDKKASDLIEVMKKYPYFTYFSPRAYFHQLKKEGKRRYILCFNPEKFLEERKQREKKISSIIAYLERWNRQLLSIKKSKNRQLLSKEIYSYLKKRKVEEAFSYLKGFIEIRPFYHQKEERVKGHITICILSYLLQVTIEYLLKKNGVPMTFQEFYRKVSKVRAVKLEIENIKKKGLKLTEIPEEVICLMEMINTKDAISDEVLKFKEEK